MSNFAATKSFSRVRKGKSIDDLTWQSLNLQDMATTPERKQRIREIARRYQDNIRKTATFKKGIENDKINEWPGDTEDRFYRRYTRSTYMGISG